jgi:hypothetical protein
MKIFLDCGTHLGEGLKSHCQLLNIDENWQIYSFEANPYTFEYLQKVLERKEYNRDTYKFFEFPHLSLLNQAVWVRDEEIKFFCSKANINDKEEVRNYLSGHAQQVSRGEFITSHEDTGLPIDGSSTIFKNFQSRSLQKLGNAHQKTIDWNTEVTVEGIDFARFILALPHDSEIYCKFDIEGSEFKVLMHLITTKAAKRIKYISVEWHYYNSLRLRLFKYLIKLVFRIMGVKIQDWR